MKDKKLGVKLLRYAIASFFGIAADLATQMFIPGNSIGEKVAGLAIGVIVGTSTNRCLENEKIVFVESRSS